jgi:hypothetical protein
VHISVGAYVCIYLQACVDTSVGMIASMCAHTCRHHSAYLCMYVRARSHFVLHVCASMIAPMCAYMNEHGVHIHADTKGPTCAYSAYTRGHDCAEVCKTETEGPIDHTRIFGALDLGVHGNNQARH